MKTIIFLLFILNLFASSVAMKAQGIPVTSCPPGNPINFGYVTSAKPDENKGYFFVRNLGNEPLQITGMAFERNDNDLFEIDNSHIAKLNGFILQPKAQTAPIKVEIDKDKLFKSDTGFKEGRFRLFCNNGQSIFAVAVFQCYITRNPNITVEDIFYIPPVIEANAGDTVQIPILFKKFTPTQQVKSIIGRISVDNTSILAPVFPTGNQSDRVRFDFPSSTLDFRIAEIEPRNDTLHVLKFIALLGSTISTPIRLTGIEMFDNSIPPNRISNRLVKTESGVFTLLNIFYDNGVPRLINTNKGVAELEVFPNPISQSADVSFRVTIPDGTAPDSKKLIFYDRLGIQVADFSPRLRNATGTVAFTVPGSVFAGITDVLYVRLITDNQSVTRLLIFQ